MSNQRKNNNNNNKVAKQQYYPNRFFGQQGRRQPAPRPRAQSSTRFNELDSYARMVADPCNATLVSGIYGADEGLLARVRSTVALPTQDSVVNATCGYAIWCPDFSCPRTGEGFDGNRTGNSFTWSSDASQTQPLNNGVTQYGVNAAGTTAQIEADPASPLITSPMVADVRCLAACMQLTYYGKMLDSSGEIAFIENLPFEDLINGGIGGNPCSVDELMVHATRKQRFGTDTVEAVYRPNNTSTNFFRSEQDSLAAWPDSGVFDPVIPSDITQASAPRCFGIVWRNTQPDAGMTLEFTKNIEWRPEVSSGIAQVPIHGHGRSRMPEVTALIDRVEKRTGSSIWQRIMKAGRGLASHAAHAGLNMIANGGSKLLDAYTGGMAGRFLQVAGPAFNTQLRLK